QHRSADENFALEVYHEAPAWPLRPVVDRQCVPVAGRGSQAVVGRRIPDAPYRHSALGAGPQQQRPLRPLLRRATREQGSLRVRSLAERVGAGGADRQPAIAAKATPPGGFGHAGNRLVKIEQFVLDLLGRSVDVDGISICGTVGRTRRREGSLAAVALFGTSARRLILRETDRHWRTRLRGPIPGPDRPAHDDVGGHWKRIPKDRLKASYVQSLAGAHDDVLGLNQQRRGSTWHGVASTATIWLFASLPRSRELPEAPAKARARGPRHEDSTKGRRGRRGTIVPGRPTAPGTGS
ncbi:hypothetical protein THAOC_18285, partial [Thalassiosira oceanica]